MKKSLIRHFAVLIAVLGVATLEAQPKQGMVYVMLFMHNEDSALGDFSAPNTRMQYETQRRGVVEFAQMTHHHQIPYCWQSDWKYLEGVLRYEAPELMAATNGKNLVRWLSEDMGISVDPHSHEKYGYNYTDVAHLMDSLGVAPSPVIGGHIYDPYSAMHQNWERFRAPLQGERYPWAWWKGDILMGSGTPNHTCDPSPSGIWRPKDKYDYWSDDANGNVICVGQYTGSVAGVRELVALYRSGAVAPEKILTASLYKGQSFPPGTTAAYEDSVVKPLLEMQACGEIKIVNFVEVVEIWKTQYDAAAHIYNSPEAVADTVKTYISSEAGGSTGILVEITVPDKARYGAAGAPVLIHVAGGWEGAGLSTGNKGWPVDDFIEICFNFPGSGRPGAMSGGAYDQRGENCIQALRDVTRFALGEQTDVSGKYLADYTGAIKPIYSNVGLCGWSNGGNATITAAGAFVAQLVNLAWIVNWESPVGDGMPNVEAGGAMNGNNPSPNPAYDPDTGVWQMEMLRYSASLSVRDNDRGITCTGSFYFDTNGNNQADPGVDFLVQPSFYQGKAYFSVRLRQAAATCALLPGTPPAHISTLAETQAYWHYRNGENWIAKAVQGNSRLMFLVAAGVQDHVQGSPDHPHVLIQYEGFRMAGARFVRLNPDRSYVETYLNQSMPAAADNDAFMPFDHLSIREGLQPSGPGGIANFIGVAAAVAELADRTQANNLNIQSGGGTTRVLSHEMPEIYRTLQNYPNPFNPATTIHFTLMQGGAVQLTLFDCLGRNVSVLVDEERPAGAHIVHLDARATAHGVLPSGVYFLQLRSARGVQTSRILLAK